MMSWPTSRFESEQKQSIRRNSGRRSFVRQITSTPSDTAIVGAIISMGQSMNLRVIAEAVETQEGWQFYGRIGVMKRKGTISVVRYAPSSSPGCSKPVFKGHPQRPLTPPRNRTILLIRR